MSCAHCIALEAENRRLSAMLGLSFDMDDADRLKVELGVTLQEARLISMLYGFKGRAISGWHILDAMAEYYSTPRSSEKIINVLVFRVRKKLGRGFIENAWGIGYSLSSAARARCDAILAQAQQVAA